MRSAQGAQGYDSYVHQGTAPPGPGGVITLGPSPHGHGSQRHGDKGNGNQGNGNQGRGGVITLAPDPHSGITLGTGSGTCDVMVHHIRRANRGAWVGAGGYACRPPLM